MSTSRGATTGRNAISDGTPTEALDGIDELVGMQLLRRQGSPQIAGARVVKTRGPLAATRGQEHEMKIGMHATTDGEDLTEIPGQMGEHDMAQGAIREIADSVPGNAYDDGGIAWNGWSHYDNGGFQGGKGDQKTFGGGGRASEKLAVPSFTGDDTDDVGSSARSYLRQVEAWRRMTYLPPSQKGLVLYQNLGGKAWIAAEELSVPRLASDGGVSYFISWINARFLDLEVARIGKAFSDFFRRLKRRQGQSIREYNTEYDRLHARLREVGCSLPQECAAWLYIDRLQLEEAQELNLLASVGNEYNLHRLQQAAVLHDRGHRKPWENGRTRKPYTAHYTGNGDDDSAGEDPRHGDDIELENGVPEDVAVAYATYQSAKERYKEQTKARGYQGDRNAALAKDAKRPEISPDEKVKLMKARSFCGSCGTKGHWHPDPECPNYGTSAQGANKGAKEVEMCHHVPAEVFSLKHDGEALLGITDTACAKAVAGTMWLQQYSDALKQAGQSPQLVRESEALRFGTGKVHHSSFHVVLCFRLGNKVVEMRTSVINGDVPLLMSKPALAQLGMVYELAENKADFTKVGLRNFDLVTTSSGHPAIPIVPAKPEHGVERLVVGETGISSSSQYMAYALSQVACSKGSCSKSTTPGPEEPTTKSTTLREATTSTTLSTPTTKAPPYRIFYDKKLSPEVKEILTSDRLESVSFMNWWEKTKINSDFWLEGEFNWFRIHVVPRRALCNPSTWKTQYTVQKNMLLQSIGDLRVTEGYCCRSGKPIETVADQWKCEQDENSFPLLWVGRSSFAKVRLSATPHSFSCAPRDGMPQAAGDLDIGAPCVDVRGAEGHDHGAQDDPPRAPAGHRDELGDEPHLGGAQEQGRRARGAVPGQGDEGQSFEAHPRLNRDTGNRTDEDRQVQGLRVPGDSATVWHVGGPRDPDEHESARGAHPLCQMVGGEGVRAPSLRRPGLDRGERDRALPGGEQQSRRSLDRGMGCGERTASVEPRLADRPEEDEARDAYGRLSGHGHGSGPEHHGRDSRPGDSTRGPEAEGQGGSYTADRGQVSGSGGSSVEKPAFAEERADSRRTTTHHEAEDGHLPLHDRDLRRDHVGPSRLLHDREQHQGHVHAHPRVREDPSGTPEDHYEHGGSHFGNKPTERNGCCCGLDHDADARGVFISDDEFERSGHRCEVSFECTPTKSSEEDPFTLAYRNKDYEQGTLLKLLETLDYDPVKATRDGVFGGKTGDKVHCFTYGMFTHGGVVGTTTKTREHDNVVRYLNGFARHHLGPKATWTSVSLSRNTSTEVHHDYHNLRGTANYTLSVGQSKGGGLWVEDKDISEGDIDNDVKWRRTGTGQWLPGRVQDTGGCFLEFDPFLKHATEPWEGTWWALTYHTTRNLYKAGDSMKKFLKQCGFPLPKKSHVAQEAEKVSAKPRASTRRNIFNNAARISVMMTALIAAAGSYLSEHVYPQVDPNPVVLFEIGGTEASQEAATIGKDVFEPMTWERYRSPEGKDSAYHIVNGGGPRELRINLDGKPDECNEAVLDLARQQVEDGGTVVVTGNQNDEILSQIEKDSYLSKCEQHKGIGDGKAFLVLFKDKGATKAVRCQDRVHEVKVVTAGEQEEGRPAVAMGATGISFGKATRPRTWPQHFVDYIKTSATPDRRI